MRQQLKIIVWKLPHGLSTIITRHMECHQKKCQAYLTWFSDTKVLDCLWSKLFDYICGQRRWRAVRMAAGLPRTECSPRISYCSCHHSRTWFLMIALSGHWSEAWLRTTMEFLAEKSCLFHHHQCQLFPSCSWYWIEVCHSSIVNRSMGGMFANATSKLY